jgi:DNA-binding MarR family transcriptional regulator
LRVRSGAGESAAAWFTRAGPISCLPIYAEPLNAEQVAAAQALATDSHGVSVLQALAGTGKTRVLGALARIFDAAGYRVIGVAPTGRAARELAGATGVAASTIHRLVSELEEHGGFAPRTPVRRSRNRTNSPVRRFALQRCPCWGEGGPR